MIMAKPLRIELAGALYHVTSRGNRREDIYLNANDRASGGQEPSMKNHRPDK